MNDAESAGSSSSSSLSQDDGVMGRPRVDVDLDDVEFLCSMKRRWHRYIVLDVSRSTIYWRMMEEGRVLRTYTQISDSALDLLIQRLKVDHPHDGEVTMTGHLTRIWSVHYPS